MKLFNLGRYGITGCLAGAFVAGCSSTTSGQVAGALPTGFASATAVVMRGVDSAKPSGFLNGETLSASRVQIKCHRGEFFDSHDALFETSGNATGPYAGTFTAHGGWSRFEFSKSWGWEGSFGEIFTIKSGSATIRGKISIFGGTPFDCSQFGPSQIPYKVKHHGKQGTATVGPINKRTFGESFN